MPAPASEQRCQAVEGQPSPGQHQHPLLAAQSAGHIDSFYTFSPQSPRNKERRDAVVTNRQSGVAFTCKSTIKRDVIANDWRQQIQILSHLSGHAAVPRLQCVYEDEQRVHVVTELCEGPTLEETLAAAHQGRFSEAQAAGHVAALADLLALAHSQGVVLRALSAANLVLVGESLKLTDWELSTFCPRGRTLDEGVGVPHYMAPELWKSEGGGHPADVWALGVALYLMLSGRVPFEAAEGQLLKAVLSHPLELSLGVWGGVSEGAKDLLRGMLCRDVARRLTAEQVLAHPWVVANSGRK